MTFYQTPANDDLSRSVAVLCKWQAANDAKYQFILDVDYTVCDCFGKMNGFHNLVGIVILRVTWFILELSSAVNRLVNR